MYETIAKVGKAAAIATAVLVVFSFLGFLPDSMAYVFYLPMLTSFSCSGMYSVHVYQITGNRKALIRAICMLIFTIVLCWVPFGFMSYLNTLG